MARKNLGRKLQGKYIFLLRGKKKEMWIHATKDKEMEKVVWGVHTWQQDPEYVAHFRSRDMTTSF
jgi:hypothetical protein